MPLLNIGMKQLLDQPIVLHDVVSAAYQSHIRHNFMGEGICPWYYTTESTQEGEVFETTSVLFHLMHFFMQGGKQSSFFDLVQPLMWEIIEKSGLPFHEFLQVRAISQFPFNTARTHNKVHTDLPMLQEPYATAVYYINGGDLGIDGDTVIFNETVLDIPEEQVNSKYKSFTEKMRVSPQQGSAVIFPGHQYHSSTLPTKTARAVLNFSWR